MTLRLRWREDLNICWRQDPLIGAPAASPNAEGERRGRDPEGGTTNLPNGCSTKLRACKTKDGFETGESYITTVQASTR